MQGGFSGPLRLKRYQLYSDASFDQNKGFGVFAWVILDHKGRIYSQGIGSGKFKNPFEAEVSGLHNGISELPDNVSILAHSDIRAIERILAVGLKSKHRCVQSLISTVRRKRLNFSVHFERDEDERHPFYHLCHDRSNVHLRAIIGRGGKCPGCR